MSSTVSSSASLQEIFKGRSEVTIIYRGDCTRRGYNGSALYTPGQRFEFLTKGAAFSFVAEGVDVKPLARITADEFNRHIHGHAIAPVEDSDIGPVAASDLCTVVRFRVDSGRPIPPDWLKQQDHRPN